MVWKNEGDCLRKGLSRQSTSGVCKDRGSILQADGRSAIRRGSGELSRRIKENTL